MGADFFQMVFTRQLTSSRVLFLLFIVLVELTWQHNKNQAQGVAFPTVWVFNAGD